MPIPKDRVPALFVRFFFDILLPEQYTKILYIDTDVRICRDGLSHVFDIEVGSYPIAAAADGTELMRPHDKEWHKKKNRIGLNADDLLFNAGILLINRKAYAEQQIGQKALTYLANCRHPDCMDDQCALNAVLRNNWLELSPIYNWTIISRAWLLDEFDPLLIHYISRSKPWRDYKNRVPAAYKSDMKRFFEVHHMGDAFTTYPWHRRFLLDLKSAFMHGVDRLGLDQRARLIRRFMQNFDAAGMRVVPIKGATMIREEKARMRMDQVGR